MNSLFPAGSRISCLNTRTILQTCYKVDSFAGRLAQASTRRSYSVSTSAARLSNSLNIRKEISRAQWRNLHTIRASVRTFASQRIITKFNELPKEYKDGEGLDFREKPLTKAEVDKIFGPKTTDVRTGNRILRVLHGRRVAGTLEDPALPNAAQGLPTKAGLEWLRKTVTVNEVESAGLRAEEELAKMQELIVTDAERLGLYKRRTPTDKEMPRKKGSTYQPNSQNTGSVYAESAFDKIRKRKEKEFERKEVEAETARKLQANEIRHNSGTLEKISSKSQVELRTPGEHPWLKYYLDRANILPERPPEMTKFQRLWPSAVFTALVIFASLLFVEVYTPPKTADRMFPDMPPSAATIIAIICANAIILAAWRIPPLFRSLNQYFMYYPGLPKPLSLLGSTFSHQTVVHYTSNMVILWFVGVRLHEEIGRANFLAVYMSTGVFASFISLSSWVFRNSFVSSSLGASGAICGIIACYLTLMGGERITLFGVFPPENWPSISATMFLALMIAMEILSMRAKKSVMLVDHWAHLGGYASGIVAAQLLNLRIRRKREAEKERRKNLGMLDRIKEGRL